MNKILKTYMLEGHSGSSLHKVGNIVEKYSSYLVNSQDSKQREQFLVKLTTQFQYAPKILTAENGVIRYQYVEGKPGFEKVDLYQLGHIAHELHALHMSAPLKETGIHWLGTLAQKNLATHALAGSVADLEQKLAIDTQVLVHGEIADVVVDGEGKITILDWDEAGLGSKYQDIGYVYFKCRELRNGDTDFSAFLAGYNDKTLDMKKIQQTAGLIAIAYAHWFNTEYRLQLGCDLLQCA